MTLMFDPFAGRQRQQELLQEAATIRLARQAQKQNNAQIDGTQSLLSRMVKLLSGSNPITSKPDAQPSAMHKLKQGDTEGSLSQQLLVNTKSR